MTSLKTVEYAFPVLASLPDNTLTALTQITVYLPEDSKVFRSVTATLTADDIVTLTGGTIASQRLDLSVNGAGATSATNANALANTGENISLKYRADFTAHFTANWGTATSRTVDCSALIDQSTGTTLGWTNVCVTLTITYEYDETSATHVKTIKIPLNAPVGALASSKPGSPTDTIPALDTFLPEDSKTFRQINIVVQGNDARTGAGDSTLSIEIDSAGAQTSGNHEGALQTSRWLRRVFPGQSWDTSTTHDFYLWGSIVAYNHMQVWLEVTYEFDPAASTSMAVSVLLPLDFQRMGGTTSADFARSEVDLMIAEPGTIANGRIAAYLSWMQSGPVAGLNARVGTGSFVTYTDGGSFFGGAGALMIRNDSALTLARGRNTFNVDIYRTDPTDLGTVLSGYMLVCYTCDVPAAGVHAANHTVEHPGLAHAFGGSLITNSSESAWYEVPEPAYYVQGAYLFAQLMVAPAAGMSLEVFASYATGGDWGRSVWGFFNGLGDSELGVYDIVFPLTRWLARWAGDLDAERWALDADRSWSFVTSVATRVAWNHILTYHSITFAVAGDVSGSAGGTVTLDLHRVSDGEKLASTSRVGDGPYSIDWYDDTEDVYVSAYEDATHVGRSAPDTAA